MTLRVVLEAPAAPFLKLLAAAAVLACVSAGLLQDVAIQTFDTAPTVLWLLGVTTPSEWDGAPTTH